MQKLIKRFKQLDSFGQGMKFNIAGNETFNTNFGAVLTLIIYMTVFVYSFTKYKNLVGYLDTAHQTQINEFELESTQKFRLSEL